MTSTQTHTEHLAGTVYPERDLSFLGIVAVIVLAVVLLGRKQVRAL